MALGIAGHHTRSMASGTDTLLANVGSKTGSGTRGTSGSDSLFPVKSMRLPGNESESSVDLVC